jgi:hypothetical protein
MTECGAAGFSRGFRLHLIPQRGAFRCCVHQSPGRFGIGMRRRYPIDARGEPVASTTHPPLHDGAVTTAPLQSSPTSNDGDRGADVHAGNPHSEMRASTFLSGMQVRARLQRCCYAIGKNLTALRPHRHAALPAMATSNADHDKLTPELRKFEPAQGASSVGYALCGTRKQQR